MAGPRTRGLFREGIFRPLSGVHGPWNVGGPVRSHQIRSHKPCVEPVVRIALASLPASGSINAAMPLVARYIDEAADGAPR